MKKHFVILSLIIVSLLSWNRAQAISFVEGLEDVPLAEGLAPVENGVLTFGNEETRLIEAYFTSQTTNFEAVASFYKNTLAQMGWILKNQTSGRLVFEREGELMEINQEHLRPFVVRLTVKSKN